MVINIPKNVKWIIDVIDACGHSAYVVGGCVRDSLLGISPKDWDITTSMTPNMVMAIFQAFGHTVVPTGIKHGTVTIVIDGEHFEVTTYRKDGNYSDGRRPDEVSFTKSIEEDLSRRDFTINAMAYNNKIGLVDPFDGLYDLQAKVIRAVGSPVDRFKEDGLRMLRAIRFSSTLGFDISPDMFGAIHGSHYLLEKVSVERKREELYKILLSDNALKGIGYLQRTEMMKYIIPEIDSYYNFESLERIPRYFGLRLAYLLLCFRSDVVRNILNRLKVDNETKKLITSGINAYNEIEDAERLTRIKMKYIIHEHGAREVYGAVMIFGAIFTDEEEYASSLMSMYEDIMNNNRMGKEPIWIKDLAIDGNDVQNAGYKGKEIGYILNELLSYVIYFPEKNNKASLFAYMEGDAI